MKKLTLVVVNWNGLDNIKGLVQSLKKQTFKEFDLLVSDNGSTDGSIEWMRKNGVKFVENGENLGFPKGANAGLKRVRTKYVGVLNDDMRLEPDCLEKLIRVLENDPRAASVQPKLLTWDGKHIESLGLIVTYGSFVATKGRGMKYRREPKANLVEVLGTGGGCSLYRTDAIRKVGFFDGDYTPGYYEDMDLSFKLRRAGYRCILDPSTAMLHKHGNTIKKVGSPFRVSYHRNRYIFLQKNGTAGMWIKTFLYMPLVTAFFTIKRPEAPYFSATAEFFKSLVTGKRMRGKWVR